MIPPHKDFQLIHHGRAYAAGDLAQIQRELRRRLRELGLQPGMTLACRFRDRFLYAQLLFLLPRMGCLFLPLDPDLPPAVSRDLLSAAGPHVLIEEAALLAATVGDTFSANRMLEKSPHGLFQLRKRKMRFPASFIFNGLQPSKMVAHPCATHRLSKNGVFQQPAKGEYPLNPREPSLLLATSGTTGEPRLVELTGEGLQRSAQAACDFLQLKKKDRWLACLPLHHIGGLSILLRCAWCGAAAVLVDEFSPGQVLQELHEHRITHLSLVPAMLYRLLEEKTAPPASLRVVLLGGASSSQALVDEAMGKGWPVCPSYGLTEAASQVATVYPPDPDWRQGEAGAPLPHMEVEVGESTGAIRIRGVSVARYCREAAQVRSFLLDARGWLDTGDVGWLDEAGCLHVTGRRDDVLISGGENIHPAVVEAVFSDCPGVAQAAVTAVDDPRWGDALVLLYQGPARYETVRRWARDRLRAGFRPRHIFHVEELPRNSLGKLLRGELKRLAREQLQDA